MPNQPFPAIKKLYDDEKRRRNVPGNQGLPIGAWKSIITQGLPRYQGTDQDIANAFLQADVNKDNSLTFDEFVTCMTKPHLDQSKLSEVDALFRRWDKSGDSKLSKDEVRQAAGQYRPETIEKILEKADTDGDGFITVQEFKAELFGSK